MGKKINRCEVCKEYTLQSTHCEKQAISPRPAKYSPLDKEGELRRQYKRKYLNKAKA